MANIKLTFLGTENSKTNDIELECFANAHDEISLVITDGDSDPVWSKKLISLDVPTAIKLHKTLRVEIAKLKESEVNHG